MVITTVIVHFPAGVVACSRRGFMGLFSSSSSSSTSSAGTSSTTSSNEKKHNKDTTTVARSNSNNLVNVDCLEDLDPFALHPLLQIPLSFSLQGVSNGPVRPIQTYCDTAAMRTVMSWDTAERLGLLPHLDRRYAGGKAVGVGSCRVLGRLPAGLLNWHWHRPCRSRHHRRHSSPVDEQDGTATIASTSSAPLGGTVTITVPSPPITILDTTGTPGVELLLGLDFLREHKAIIDLRRDELRILLVNRIIIKADDDDDYDNENEYDNRNNHNEQEEDEELCIPFIRPRGGSPVMVTSLSGGGGRSDKNKNGSSSLSSSLPRRHKSLNNNRSRSSLGSSWKDESSPSSSRSKEVPLENEPGRPETTTATTTTPFIVSYSDGGDSYYRHGGDNNDDYHYDEEEEEFIDMSGV